MGKVRWSKWEISPSEWKEKIKVGDKTGGVLGVTQEKGRGGGWKCTRKKRTDVQSQQKRGEGRGALLKSALCKKKTEGMDESRWGLGWWKKKEPRIICEITVRASGPGVRRNDRTSTFRQERCTDRGGTKYVQENYVSPKMQGVNVLKKGRGK